MLSSSSLPRPTVVVVIIWVVCSATVPPVERRGHHCTLLSALCPCPQVRAMRRALSLMVLCRATYPPTHPLPLVPWLTLTCPTDMVYRRCCFRCLFAELAPSLPSFLIHPPHPNVHFVRSTFAQCVALANAERVRKQNLELQACRGAAGLGWAISFMI